MEPTKNCLKDLSVFSLLDWEEIESICENGYVKNYRKGEIIFFEADSEKKLYLLVDGQVKLSMLSSEGREKVMTILQAGDIFGEISLFDHDPHPLTAEVVEEAKLMILEWSNLEEIIMDQPRLALKIIEALSKKTRLLTSQVRDLVFHDAIGRLANLLIRFAKDFGKETEEGTMIELILTHQEIANLLGVSRVTVTKTLNKLIDQGLIKIKERKIYILDHQGLNECVKDI
ncbi:MAG: Crp/Fnr family transcriptional regulator [Bacillota bacterium]